MINLLKIRPVHSFPARMATSIALNELAEENKSLKILDPMVGSGTSIVISKYLGHDAIGFDTDPLSVLISKTWCMDIDEEKIRKTAKEVLISSKRKIIKMKYRNAYPCKKSDIETMKFIRFWFRPINRLQLTALSRSIHSIKNVQIRDFLWCAFSRMIITKNAGISLAKDLSHSRPHRDLECSIIKPFENFIQSVEYIIKLSLFKNKKNSSKAIIKLGDARKLPVLDNSIDCVITSPPYLNAIDYLRCHKFTLIWMGYSLKQIRKIRSGNIGGEIGKDYNKHIILNQIALDIAKKKLPTLRFQNIIYHYVSDMHSVLSEIKRVLKSKGKAIIIIGNSTMRGIKIDNCKAIRLLGMLQRLKLIRTKRHRIPYYRRYLPPPNNKKNSIHNRIRNEQILIFQKT